MRRKGWSVRALGAHQLDARGLPSWMTFTRGAGSWSRQTAPALDGTTFIELGTSQNTPRFDYDPVSGRTMLLIEPTRTNQIPVANFLMSAPPTDPPASWSNVGAGYTVTANGPHGGAYLALPEGIRGIYAAGTLVLAGGTLYQCSQWVKGTALPAGQEHFTLETDPGIAQITLPTGTFDWTRIIAPATTVGAAANDYYQCTVAGPTGVRATCLPQVEAGDCATSWIGSSAGALARAAELCAIDPGVVGANQGYVSFLWRPDYASTTALTVSPVLFQWAPNWELYFDPADDKLKLTVDSAAGAESAALTFSRQGLLHVAVRYGTFGTRLYVNGVETTDPSAWGAPALAPYLGSRAASVNCRPSAYGDLLFGAT